MRIKLFASVRQAAGVSEVGLDVEPDTTVRRVVEQLVDRHPPLAGMLVDERGGLRDAVSIFVDGRNIRLRDGLDTRLHGGEALAVFPPIAGGGEIRGYSQTIPNSFSLASGTTPFRQPLIE